MLNKIRPICSLNQLIDDLYSTLSFASTDYEKWLVERLQESTNSADIYITYSLVPRFIPRVLISLQKGCFSKNLEELNQSKNTWSADQIARLIILLKASEQGEEKFQEIIKMLLSTADYHEQISIYKSLIFLPNSEFFVDSAIDGLRSNIGEVFDSIALHNSYPRIYFEEAAWNQMVLKALFIGRPIKEIVGLDERTNSRLAKIAIDLAHERWAAGREVNPDLWRVTVGFLDENNSKDIKKLLVGNEKEQQVGKYLCSVSAIESLKDLADNQLQSDFSWEQI